uniref:Uncharacterized protein n=1 Tax=Fusarium oxysporum (strain Fo5176) TaxID=660025 RepID=A0A0D2YAJ3_FUSOF
MISNGFAGPEGVENVGAMLEKRPLYEDYWEDKRIPVENIDNIPILSDKPRPKRDGFESIHSKSEYINSYEGRSLSNGLIRKIDNKGRQLSHLNYPCPVAIDQVPDVNTAKTWGPQGFLRASHHISLNAEGGPIVSDDSSHETDVFTATAFDSPLLQVQLSALRSPSGRLGCVCCW